MFLSDFAKAVSQMFDRRFLRVMLMGLGLTIALLFAVYGTFLWAIDGFLPETLTLPGGATVTWVDDLLSVTSILLMLLLSVFLMVPVASAFTSLFLEDVAAAVESRYYPHLPPVSRIPWGEALRDSVNFFGVLVAVNALALILYFFVGPFAPIMFWVVNGFLLGREYFQLVAMRRVGREGAKAARRRHMPKIWIAGTLMAAPLSIPIVNLFVPILGAATFTHLYHRLEPDIPGSSARTPTSY